MNTQTNLLETPRPADRTEANENSPAAAKASGGRNSGRDERDAHSRHFKPRLQQLLHTLRVDVVYERGRGNYLYHRDEHGKEVEVLDLVGGYGSLLLGHSHPALVNEAQRLLSSARPMHAQGSLRIYARRLAAELSRRASGDYTVIFGNSGTEAVEAAMKHALLESGGKTFIALQGAFHGKTLGALRLTAPSDLRDEFELPGPKVFRIAPNSIEELEAAFKCIPDPAGFVFEPILGEGGVRPLSPEFVRHAARLCAEHGIPLIADECQTGLGRTGTFLASEQLGIRPDYVILSKSLGGGLAKISALLIKRNRHLDTFDLRHTSTYAEDDFSCALALKTLDLIDDPMMKACREKGEKLLAKLRVIAARYPDVIAGVRGRGLMIGLEFRRLNKAQSFLLRILSAQEDLVWIVMGYLLNVRRIRVAPTLGDPFTLRIEPSALFGDREIEHTLAGLEDVCSKLSRDDAPGLTSFLAPSKSPEPLGNRLPRTNPKFAVYDETRFRTRGLSSPTNKVGWLCHLVDSNDLPSLEPAFAEVPMERREALLNHLAPRIAPVAMTPADVRSATGARVRFQPILLPFTSQWIKRCIDARETSLPRALVQMGIEFARSLGCQNVTLGQYTSIVTHNGLRLDKCGMGVSTGNSYPVALAVRAVKEAQRETGRDPSRSILVVAGASGNIGRTCAELLAPCYGRTVLVGNRRPGSEMRLRELARRIPNTTVSTDLAAVRDGDVVVAALNAVDAPLTRVHFKPGAVVCDLSVPAALKPEVASSRPDLAILHGGIARLPGGEDLEIVGFPLPRGQVYGCMAEALLLGLEEIGDSSFTGPVTTDHVSRVSKMARRHGFFPLSANARTESFISSEEAADSLQSQITPKASKTLLPSIAEAMNSLSKIQSSKESYAITY